LEGLSSRSKINFEKKKKNNIQWSFRIYAPNAIKAVSQDMFNRKTGNLRVYPLLK
jgi:hypothetical protein